MGLFLTKLFDFACFLFLIKFIVIQDKNVTSSPHPYLTECFRDTVLQWLPMGVFWLVLPLWLWMLHKRKIQPQPLPVSVLFVTKVVKICVHLFAFVLLLYKRIRRVGEYN